MKKTVALISDMHCGHIFGLCPEPYQIKEPKDKVGYPNLVMLSKAQAEMWDTYLSFVEPFKGVDLLVCVGDMLDGTQKHSEGSELISLASDPGVQIDMAELAISQWQAKEEWYIAGTPYHSGKRTDWEERLAKKRSIVTNAHFSGENVFAIRDDDTGNSFKIHAKHHVGGSATLYGQASQTDKERASYLEASYIGGFPHVDLFVRGHVHKYSYVESSDLMNELLRQ